MGELAFCWGLFVVLDVSCVCCVATWPEYRFSIWWHTPRTGIQLYKQQNVDISTCTHTHTHTHARTRTRTRLTALFPGLPRWAGTRKVKPIWTLLQQETVSGSGISWAICKSAPCSRQTTTPAPHHSVLYRPDALPANQPTASKHWRYQHWRNLQYMQ